jgi:tetratricopeptide (TPR) repeat protein
VVPAARADLASAQAAWDLGDRGQAARLIREWVRVNPQAVESPEVAALLARTAGNPTEAMGRWDEVIARNPGGPLVAEAHWAKGIHAYSAGLYVSAVREFETLVGNHEEDFDRGRAYLWKGLAELGASAAADAMFSFDRARKTAGDPADRVTAELAMAHAAFQAGELDDALSRYRDFERDYREDGRASSAARRVAECLRLLGRTAEASREATRIEQEYPGTAEGTLARAALRRTEPPAAVTAEAVPESSLVPEAAVPRRPFVVQVASMGELGNAVALRRRIRALGIQEVTIEMADSRTGPVHRVLLGPYDREEDAQVFADSVATLGDLNPRVREVDE